MAKFKVGDRVVDVTTGMDFAKATVVCVNNDQILVKWDESSVESSVDCFWPASDFELINPTKEPEMKCPEILEPREPVKSFKPKVGVHPISGGSELVVQEVGRNPKHGDFVGLRFGVGGSAWQVFKPDIAELIEVLQALHDAMDD